MWPAKHRIVAEVGRLCASGDSSAGGGGHEDEGRVAVEGVVGLVVGDRGVGLGVAGGALHLAERDALE